MHKKAKAREAKLIQENKELANQNKVRAKPLKLVRIKFKPENADNNPGLSGTAAGGMTTFRSKRKSTI